MIFLKWFMVSTVWLFYWESLPVWICSIGCDVLFLNLGTLKIEKARYNWSRVRIQQRPYSLFIQLINAWSWREVKRSQRKKDFSESQNCFQTHFRKKREKYRWFSSRKFFRRFRGQIQQEKTHIWGQGDNGNFIFMEWLNCSLRWVFCSLGRHLYKTKECSSADIRPILQKNVQVYTFT